MADEITYDVFLSHNSQDKPAVEALARRLSERCLITWPPLRGDNISEPAIAFDLLPPPQA